MCCLLLLVCVSNNIFIDVTLLYSDISAPLFLLRLVLSLPSCKHFGTEKAKNVLHFIPYYYLFEVLDEDKCGWYKFYTMSKTVDMSKSIFIQREKLMRQRKGKRRVSSKMRGGMHSAQSLLSMIRRKQVTTYKMEKDICRTGFSLMWNFREHLQV